MGNITSWDFRTKHVEPDILAENQNFISAETVVVCAAPAQNPSGGLAPSDILPIGVLESAAIAQNKAIQQLFEIGSSKPYFIPGRTRVQLGLSRIIFNGNSLMGKIYEAEDAGYAAVQGMAPGDDVPGAVSNEGTGYYMFNLASSYFNKPFGLIFMFRDSEEDNAAMIYLENCMLQAHSMNIGANQTIIMENVSILADNVLTVGVTNNQYQPSTA